MTVSDSAPTRKAPGNPRFEGAHGHAALRFVLVAATCLLVAAASSARPEKIRPGHSYYSDDQVLEAGVRDIAAEKNYEEVYQAYRYFEVVYDEEGRVAVFKEYKRGEIVRTEEYRYREDGGLAFRVTHEPGKPPETTAVDATE